MYAYALKQSRTSVLWEQRAIPIDKYLSVENNHLEQFLNRVEHQPAYCLVGYCNKHFVGRVGMYGAKR